MSRTRQNLQNYNWTMIRLDQSLLAALSITKTQSFSTRSANTDQTSQMYRLICISAGRPCGFVSLFGLLLVLKSHGDKTFR